MRISRGCFDHGPFIYIKSLCNKRNTLLHTFLDKYRIFVIGFQDKPFQPDLLHNLRRLGGSKVCVDEEHVQ